MKWGETGRALKSYGLMLYSNRLLYYQCTLQNACSERNVESSSSSILVQSNNPFMSTKKTLRNKESRSCIDQLGVLLQVSPAHRKNDGSCQIDFPSARPDTILFDSSLLPEETDCCNGHNDDGQHLTNCRLRDPQDTVVV